MVYSCAVREPYECRVDRELIGATWEVLEDDVCYANPNETDLIARMPQHNRLAQGYAVEPDKVPTKLRWGDKRKVVPDFVEAPAPIVSERVKEIVIDLEPNTHQFLPIDLHYRNTSEPFARYYWFVICKLLDTTHHDKTTYELIKHKKDPRVGLYKMAGENGELFHDEMKTHGHHCWRERFVQRRWMMSDELYKVLNSGSVVGLSVRKKEVL